MAASLLEKTTSVVERVQEEGWKTIVGHCPQCGAPIYGKSLIRGNEIPESVYSCTCWRKVGMIENVMEKK